VRSRIAELNTRQIQALTRLPAGRCWMAQIYSNSLGRIGTGRLRANETTVACSPTASQNNRNYTVDEPLLAVTPGSSHSPLAQVSFGYLNSKNLPCHHCALNAVLYLCEGRLP
jgi:hypothetical protein